MGVSEGVMGGSEVFVRRSGREVSHRSRSY